MTASLFPAYALARLFVTRPAAIACGVATAVDPGSRLHGDADPGAARVLLGDARALAPRARADPPRPPLGRARGGAIIVAPAVRSELEVLIVAGLLAAALMAVDERSAAGS